MLTRNTSLDSFDWQAYFHNYPELFRPPLSLRYNASEAFHYYQTEGKKRGHVAARVRLRARYTAESGLCNQMYAHLAAVVIAQAVGAEVVLAPALSRASFQPSSSWQLQNVSSLLDVEHLIAYAAGRGLTVLPTPPFDPSKLQALLAHLPRGGPPPYGDKGCVTAALTIDRDPEAFNGAPWGPNLTTVAALVRRAAVEAAEHYQQGTGRAPPCVNLDLPATFFQVRLRSAQHLAAEAYCQGFRYNRDLVRLARHVVQRIGGGVNGLHLRMELDAKGFARVNKTDQSFLRGAS